MLQRTQLYSGLPETWDAYSKLLETQHLCCFNRSHRDAYQAMNHWINCSFKLQKYQLRCSLNETHILHDVKLELNSQRKNMPTPRVTSCKDQRKDVVRSCLNFGFEGVTHPPLQNNKGIGGTPPNKIDDQRSWLIVNFLQKGTLLQISRQ